MEGGKEGRDKGCRNVEGGMNNGGNVKGETEMDKYQGQTLNKNLE